MWQLPGKKFEEGFLLPSMFHKSVCQVEGTKGLAQVSEKGLI